MLFLAQTNFIALLLGLLIGLVVAFWAFRGRRNASPPAAEDLDSRAQETPLS